MASNFDVNSMAGLSGMDVHIEVLPPKWCPTTTTILGLLSVVQLLMLTGV